MPPCDAPLILLTAFDPFGGETVNPAALAVEAVTCPRAILCKLTLPTVFGEAVEAVTEAIGRLSPAAVVMVGQAGGRAAITPETVAINLEDATIPDNRGNRPVDRPVVAGGPAAYFTTLPVKAMVAAMKGEGIPAARSLSAGSFVCNHLTYGVLHYLATHGLAVPAGFIHVPYAPEQTAGREGVPSLPVEVVVRGLELSLDCLVDMLTGEGGGPTPGDS